MSMKVNTDNPQGYKLSPSLFSFYIADMPRPVEPVKRACYADDPTEIPDREDSLHSYPSDNILLVQFPKIL